MLCRRLPRRRHGLHLAKGCKLKMRPSTLQFPPGRFHRTFAELSPPAVHQSGQQRTKIRQKRLIWYYLVSSALSDAIRFWLPDNSRKRSWARQFRGSQQEGMRGRRSRCGNPTVGVTKRAGEIAPKLENCAEFRAVWLDTREALTSQRAPPRLGSGRSK